ncbi:alpha/beta hydrolase (plasmid) [Bacillus sp. H8-1]|nr:alpha/beta hydrolase [Bacillus sp. H8-1]
MKKKIIISVLFLIISSMSLACEQRSNGKSPSKFGSTPNYAELKVPVLYVHGFLGGEKTFNKMIKRFEEKGWGTKTYKCIVSEQGKVGCKKEKEAIKGQYPIIQVIFKNNKASIGVQAAWLGDISQIIGEKYNVNQINIVAHSMGGLASTKYIIDHNVTGGVRYPLVRKLVTLGSPIMGANTADLTQALPSAIDYSSTPAANDMRRGSEALNELYNNRYAFEFSNTRVLSIAGNVSKNKKAPQKGESELNDLLGDESVTVRSAWYLQNYTKKITLESFPVSHSKLHENEKIDNIVNKFLRKDIGNDVPVQKYTPFYMGGQEVSDDFLEISEAINNQEYSKAVELAGTVYSKGNGLEIESLMQESAKNLYKEAIDSIKFGEITEAKEKFNLLVTTKGVPRDLKEEAKKRLEVIKN